VADGTTTQEIFTTNKFWVQIDGLAEGFFRECSGLQLQTEVFEYSEGGLNEYTHKLPVRTKVGNITLKRGFVRSDILWDWYSKVVSGTIQRRSVTILLYHNKVEARSNTSASWKLEDALPIKWVGPTFKADENAMAVEQLEFVCGAITKWPDSSQN